MTLREELMSVPERKWDHVIENVAGVYVLPTGRKHDSGYACMYFVATYIKNGKAERIRFGGGCDDLSFYGLHFRMDCMLPGRILHIWNDRKNFSVSAGLSSISLIE